ncbi:MAG: hypothetical protein NTV00_03280 [Methylococcales bacterium]|nr:hypothetical protein [Methylococcales bacterium]
MINYLNTKTIDYLVVNKKGELRHIRVEKTTWGEGTPSISAVNTYIGATPTPKKKSLEPFDEPIEDYYQWINNQRIDAEKEKKEAAKIEKAKKITIAVATLVSVCVPILAIGGVTCRLLMQAATIADIIQGLDVLNDVIEKPEEIINEKFLGYILEQGFKKVLVLDYLKLSSCEKPVFEVLEEHLIRKPASDKISTALVKKFKVSKLGYNIDYTKVNTTKNEFDKILQHIHVFRYQYDSGYKKSHDGIVKFGQNIVNSELERRGIKISKNEYKPFYTPPK